MRRFRRAARLALVGLWLACCCAVAVLWVRGYWRLDGVAWGGWFISDEAARSSRHVVALEDRGRVTSARGSLAFSRRTQRSVMPRDAAETLVGRDGVGRWTFGSYELGAGNTYGTPARDTFWRRLGFYHDSRTGRSPTTVYVETVCPMWAVAGVLCLPALAWFAWRRTHRPPAPGLCPGCGYDLRATPTRCPECGRERAATAAAGNE